MEQAPSTFHGIRPWAVIAAGGGGTRMAPAALRRPKQFLLHQGLPLYYLSALTFSRCARVAGIVFVLPAGHLREEENRLRALNENFPAGAHGENSPPEEAGLALSPVSPAPLGLPWKIVEGGATRRDSVYNGLRALPPHCAFVLIHDAARPFMSAALAQRVIDGLEDGADGVIPGLPVTDTVKSARNGLIEATLERDTLFTVQTPQAFRLETLLRAHERAREEGREATDDAGLLEHYGRRVRIVPGESANRKITTSEDLALLQEPAPAPATCCGYGYDVHRYGGERPMKIGGVSIPGAPGIIAHSDGDVLLHALMDAILGCACLGDIGGLFPDSDPAFDNINSAVLLDEVLRRARAAGLEPVQADCTIIAQTPRIAPHAPAIRRNLARLLALDESRINIKATTEEGLGFTGERRGIKAVVLLTALRAAADPRRKHALAGPAPEKTAAAIIS